MKQKAEWKVHKITSQSHFLVPSLAAASVARRPLSSFAVWGVWGLHQSEGLGEQRRRVLPLRAPKLHQHGPLKGSCMTCFLRELLLVCRGWACLSLACWHTILGLLQTNVTESDACPEYLVKITSPLPSLPLCLLPLLHFSPLHLPPLFIYFLPLLLHHNGHWLVGGSQLYS